MNRYGGIDIDDVNYPARMLAGALLALASQRTGESAEDLYKQACGLLENDPESVLEAIVVIDGHTA